MKVIHGVGAVVEVEAELESTETSLKTIVTQVKDRITGTPTIKPIQSKFFLVNFNNAHTHHLCYSNARISLRKVYDERGVIGD